ncbi:MAG: hypothetical protein ACTS3F_09375 [Phycisphaerales bacterium]
MSTAVTRTISGTTEVSGEPIVESPRRAMRFPLAMTAVLAGFAVLPRVHQNTNLLLAFLGASALLLAWQGWLWARARSTARSLKIEYYKPMPVHFVQAGVQASLYAYWGFFWPEIYAQAPLIIAQMVFLLLFDGMVSWARGWNWRVSFVPVPIILSTNLFLWFRDDIFYFQFVLVAIIVLAKHFLTWERDGKRTHIFNPSAFGLSIVSIGVILAGATHLTYARELATTITEPPMIYVYIFAIGLIVQFFFRITLMVMSTAITLAIMNLIYTQITGVYHFGNTTIAASVFLGLHLLLTDPATSPRTNLGRVAFGAFYGIGYFFMFDLLGRLGVPELYSKLFPVPILNLFTLVIDRATRTGILGRINKAWESAGSVKKLNLIHMAVWATAFTIMAGTGFLGGRHPGDSIVFWQKAVEEDRHEAGRKLVMVAGARAASGSGIDATELGLICLRGQHGVNENPAAAFDYFAQGCRLGDMNGCANLAIHFLFEREMRQGSEDDIAFALDRLTDTCINQGDGLGCYLVGIAHEHGWGREQDPALALQYYARLPTNPYAAKGIARIMLTTGLRTRDPRPVVATLDAIARNGDIEAMWYLAYMFDQGIAVPPMPERAREILRAACEAARPGSDQACKALEQPTLPPYEDPRPIAAPSYLSIFDKR